MAKGSELGRRFPALLAGIERSTMAKGSELGRRWPRCSTMARGSELGRGLEDAAAVVSELGRGQAGRWPGLGAAGAARVP
jgi:hypothetical protein